MESAFNTRLNSGLRETMVLNRRNPVLQKSPLYCQVTVNAFICYRLSYITLNGAIKSRVTIFLSISIIGISIRLINKVTMTWALRQW